MSKWGPAAWDFLHRSSFAYPDNPTKAQQDEALAFYRSLGVMLPCPKCAEHWTKMIKKSPPETESKDKLAKWLWARHNEVNVRLRKPQVSFRAARLKFDDRMRKKYAILSCARVFVMGIAVALLVMVVMSWVVKSSCPCAA